MSAWPATLWVTRHPAEWGVIFQAVRHALPPEVAEVVGAEVEELAAAVAEGSPVTVASALSDGARVPVVEGGRDGPASEGQEPTITVRGRDAAEMTALLAHPIRASLAPRGAAMAAALEALGRGWTRRREDACSDSGTGGYSARRGRRALINEPISTADAAAILDVSERRVRKLASRLGGRDDLGRGFVFERAAVEAYARERGALSHARHDGEAAD